MAIPYDDFLSILKRYATEDFDLKKIKKNRTIITNMINKNKIIDPIQDMNWHMENIRNKFGDPYDLSNKVSDLQQIDEFDNYLKQISNYPNQAKETFKQLGASYAAELDPISSKQVTNATANIMTNMSLYDNELSFYSQQVLGIRNIQKYGNKDILDEMHARQLINESESLKNEIINNQSRQLKNTKDKNLKLKNANKSYRPEVTMNGNNVEIDSIYNHSVPKKVVKSPEPEIEITPPLESEVQRYSPKLTAEEQAAVDKANAQWKADNEARYSEIEKQINDMYKADDEIYGSPEDILNPNYKSKFEPIEETTKKTIKTQKKTNANNTKIKNETIEKLNKTKQLYEDILTDWTSASGDFNRQINTRTVGPHNIYVEGKQYLDDIEDLKNNYNVDDYVDGSYTMEQEVFKYSEGKGINGEDVLKIEGDLVDAPNAYASDLNKTLEEAKKTMSPEDYQKYKNNFDVEKALVKTDAGQTKLNRKRVVRNKAGLLDDIGKPGAIMTGLNILGAVGDYKDARRKGHGVISSAARAGVQFAVGEALGLWAIPVMAAKEVPGLVMKGAETLYKENRRMNSAANFQTFGDVQFQDTQQLATMRQSGMEMAKMSQYNLQQTLMGNEATYLHR